MAAGSAYADVCRIRTRRRGEMKFWPSFSLLRRIAGHLAKKRPPLGPDGSWMARLVRNIGIRPIIFSINCYIATILALFIAFSLDLKTPAWAMLTVYLTSQPLSGALRGKAVYRVIGTFIGGAAMVAIVPNLVDAPELTTLAIILWVALCVFISLLDRTPRSYAFVLSGYTAALIGFPSVLAPGGVFDTAVSRVEEITLGVICAAIVHSLVFPKSALSAFREKLKSAMADARRWIADAMVQQA